ncbi:Beta-ketoacyl-[acyl-carrier-protein] synthase I [Durusdinium trenchii]|uniref:Beta-ketoacyl-[acyl-carrier-protein] synthase I n=1 Tax=Durusdinium trenchii TaxID=1381693 RepID=A0ABP0JVE3_9DINO
MPWSTIRISCGLQANGGKKKKKLPTDLTTFPQSVLTVVGKRYGLRQMVGQVCWSLTKSVDEVRSAHQGVETFARFLEESYDAVDLLFYLEMRWAARQMTMPRGVWTSWRKTPQVFTGPHQRALASKTTCPNNKPPLTLKQALAAVREGIDPEAPEALKAKIFSRLKAENGGDSTFDWDHFLSICTQEFRKARSIAVPKQVQGFAQQIRERWQLSVPDAFEKFERTGSGLLRGDAFKEVCEELDVWCLLDVEKKGYVEKEAWNVLDVHDEADQGNDEELVYPPVYPPGWDDQLSPEESEAIQQEAREVARRLLSSLEEHEEVKPSEVLGWALRSVLQRKGHDLQRGARDEQRGFAPQRSGQEVSQSGDPRSAWTTGAPTASDGGDAERSLEDTVREHLAAATNQLVDEGLQEAGGTWTKEMAPVKEALLEEFMMVTDALMEALVIGDLDAWLQQLHIEEADAEQHKHFQELAAEFQELLTADEASEEQLVSRVCAATTSFQELKVLCRVRADELLQEHGVGGTPPQSEPTGDSTQAEGAEGLEIPEAF